MSDILHNSSDSKNYDDFSILLQEQSLDMDAFFLKKTIKNTINIEPLRYHKQLFQYINNIDIIPVESTMYIKKGKNNENILRFNLCSAIFDSRFNSKRISHVELMKNYDGSVDFIVKFDKQNGEKNKKYITKAQHKQKQVNPESQEIHNMDY